jgi:hypothetical protein
MNKYTPYTNFAAVAETLLTRDWIFAKTMPENPHWYALRKNFKVDADFIKAVRFI